MDCYVWTPRDMADFEDANMPTGSPSSAFSDGSEIPSPPELSDVEDIVDETLVSVSTTFHPEAHLHSLAPDLVLLSNDSVLFYVHADIVGHASDSTVQLTTPATTPVSTPSASPGDYYDDPDLSVTPVPESSEVLNLVLHVAYNISCVQYLPSFDKLAAAVKVLRDYGLDARYTMPPSFFHAVLLSHAPTSPLELYTLAAHHGIHDLAVAASAHLLSFALSTITDEMAEEIGPAYLKRLFFLHLGRCDALRRVLQPLPDPHFPTPNCDSTKQKKLAVGWAMAASFLLWSPKPDTSTDTIHTVFGALGNDLTCELCRHALVNRIDTLVLQWSMVKRTI